ncbi:hypothetical protein [Hoeflea prorocentri]|uniref:DUF3426 domain-containing protein n=1 Tax=Hoeflea prorocentri TaxID=1922333 RepID=A0A9X3ZK03_9HYPH|nr:hypothetical protein [Hoeflea prorocentri]MCY6383638.1 hypothetical protein [Hoeflea prorocentri]MDA5401438.1 hypothetical protein [Hoeflea prorocentri]
MPGHGAKLSGPLFDSDIIDAEFEHVDDDIRPTRPVRNRAPAVRPEVRATDFSRSVPEPHGGANFFTNQPFARREDKKRSASGFVGLVAAVSLLAFWVSGGHALFSGGAGSGDGLSLSDVSVDPLRVRDESYFVVHGVIKNNSADSQDVPLLTIAPDETQSDELPLYARAGKEKLAAGESTRFRVRVPSNVRDYGNLSVSLAGGGTAR